MVDYDALLRELFPVEVLECMVFGDPNRALVPAMAGDLEEAERVIAECEAMLNRAEVVRRGE